MFGVIASVKVQDGKVEEFESVVSGLAKAVAANEPECSSFGVFKVRNAPGEYKFLEVYASRDAFKAHAKSDHFTAAHPKMEACFAAPMQVEMMEGLAD